MAASPPVSTGTELAAQCPGLNQFSKDNVDDESPEGARDSPHTTRRHGA